MDGKVSSRDCCREVLIQESHKCAIRSVYKSLQEIHDFFNHCKRVVDIIMEFEQEDMGLIW